MVRGRKNQEDTLVVHALNEHRWINTPVSYTKCASQLSTIQQDIMLMVSGSLQDYMKSFFEDRRHIDKTRPNPLMRDEMISSMPPIHIELSKLSLQHNHYNDVDILLQSMKSMWVNVPTYDEETGLKGGDIHAPVFDSIFVPTDKISKQGETFQYSGDRGLRRRSYIEVTINPRAAAYAFDMSTGYVNHLERIALWCTSCYTPRLYLLLMRHVCHGNMTPVIDYEELKECLGMIERDDVGNVVNEKYSGKFNKFQNLVLKVAKRDMDKLNSENRIEIVLDDSKAENGCEVIYPDGKKRGNPSAIKFHIKRSALGLLKEMKQHRECGEKKILDGFMKQYPYVDKDVLKEILSTVQDNDWKNVQNFMIKTLPVILEQPHRWNGTPESYIILQLKNYINSLSIEDNAPIVTKKASAKKEDTRVLGEYRQEWNRFLSAYDGPLRNLLAVAEHKGSDRGFVWIEFPDKQSLVAYEEAEASNKAEAKRMHDVLASVMPTPTSALVIVRGCKR